MPRASVTLGRYVAALCASALGVSGLPVVALSAQAAAASGVVTEDPSGVLTRPDAVSAAVTARVSGRRVEDMSQRTETTLLFANPDGTWTAEQDTEPVRVQDDDGTWSGIDTDLVEVPGGTGWGMN